MTPTLHAVTADELKARIGDDPRPRIIDVRSAAEFAAAHIRGSFNVPLPVLTEHADELPTALGKDVVLVCQTGIRAEDARQRLAAAGVNGAMILHGGITGYAAAGCAVVRGPQRWALERQIRLTAGMLVLLGTLGSLLLAAPLIYLALAIGAGLTFSALSNTCAMGAALSKMPWNRATTEPTLDTVKATLTRASDRY